MSSQSETTSGSRSWQMRALSERVRSSSTQSATRTPGTSCSCAIYKAKRDKHITCAAYASVQATETQQPAWVRIVRSHSPTIEDPNTITTPSDRIRQALHSRKAARESPVSTLWLPKIARDFGDNTGSLYRN